MTIIEDFDRKASEYSAFSEKLQVLLKELVSEKGLRIHSVATRLKSRESFERKLAKETGKYSELAQMTDLCATRIITYMEDEVDAVADLAESEFEVDRSNSIDKRKSQEADQFGYVSVHYVLTLKQSRADLPEYRRFAGLKFELQIRSILQHAWAEIEHDLQYKSEQEIPKEVKRRFARLASLLELADIEFVGLRKQILAYQGRVAAEVKTTPNEVPLDRDSLRAFIAEDPLVRELDTKIAAVTGSRLSDEISDQLPLRILEHAGIRTVGTLRSVLAQKASRFLRFSSLRRALDYGGTLWRGASILQFSTFLLLDTNEPEENILKTLDRFHFPKSHQRILLDAHAEALESEAGADHIAGPNQT